MTTAAAKERLTHLLALAGDETPEGRRRLVGELCDLLLAWPADYPLPMRAPFEQLLEHAMRNVSGEARADLAARFVHQPDAPVSLLNQLFFDAPESVKTAILRRNALASDAPPADAVPQADEPALIAAARSKGHETLESEFARALGLETSLARRILSEPSGEALAAACKGAHLTRATFSALALLFAPETGGREARLSVYDAVPQHGAESLVRYWRNHPGSAANQDAA